MPPLVGIISFKYRGTITETQPTPNPPTNRPNKILYKFLGTCIDHPIVHIRFVHNNPPLRPKFRTMKSEHNVPITAPPGTTSTIAIYQASLLVCIKSSMWGKKGLIIDISYPKNMLLSHAFRVRAIYNFVLLSSVVLSCSILYDLANF